MARLLRFFALTFGLTWVFFIGAVLSPDGGSATANPVPALRGLLVFLGTMTPGLVAILLTAQAKGLTGVKALLLRLIQWQTGVRWYLFALCYMTAIKLAVAFTHRMVTGAWLGISHESIGTALVAIIFSTPFQSGEEVGWRGYALPLLAERIGFAWGSIVLGLIWACWHLPLFYLRLPGNNEYGQPFPIWALGVTALSVAFAWLYTRVRGSLLLLILMHSAVNNIPHFVSSAAPDATQVLSFHAAPPALLTSTFLCLAALYFLVRMRGTSRSRSA